MDKKENEFNQKLSNLDEDLIFTMKSSTSSQLLFLAIYVKIEENMFTTSIYKKPSNTKVLL